MIKGQRLKISDITREPVFDVGVTMDLSGPGEIGAACFCLDARGSLADGRWLVYEENRCSPGAAVRFMGASRDDGHDFELTLASVAPEVERIVVVAYVGGPGAMNQLTYGHLRVKAGGAELARYVMSGHDFGQEKAVMLAEIYRKSGEWRLYLNGQGFAEGIEGVFRHFDAESLWEALSLRDRREQQGSGAELSPEQAREILEVLRKSAPREEDGWPSQEGDGQPSRDGDGWPDQDWAAQERGVGEDPGRVREGGASPRQTGKPPTIH
ncbi:MAG: TerD family protein [Deltaproteobacteria bacterium]|jgi:stress response protein SCP2|nr:TerD family protein [Deltaproteobacteria bacterium]